MRRAIDISRCHTVADVARAIRRAWPDPGPEYPPEWPNTIHKALREVGADAIHDAVDFLNDRLAHYHDNVERGEPKARHWLASAKYQLGVFAANNRIDDDTVALPLRKVSNVN